MTTRYQKSQIEDVAFILGCHTTAAGMDNEKERMEWLTWIAKSFANLFAADDPPCIFAAFGCTTHGFDRATFLAACGLESEG